MVEKMKRVITEELKQHPCTYCEQPAVFDLLWIAPSELRLKQEIPEKRVWVCPQHCCDGLLQTRGDPLCATVSVCRVQPTWTKVSCVEEVI